MILVTGTTGGLGCHILKHLLGDPLVVRVFAYNKSSSSVEAQRAAFVQNGLNVELLDSYKLRFVFGDMHKPLLGLTVPAYKEVCVLPCILQSRPRYTQFVQIQESVTHIIHNGALVPHVLDQEFF